MSRTLRRRFVLAAVFLVLAGAASPTAAQITFEGVRWGSPPDSVLARLDAAGWRHVRTYPDSTMRFRRADDAVAIAEFHHGALAGVDVFLPPPADLEAAFRAAVDSVRNVRGVPRDTTGGTVKWSDGVTGVEVEKVSAQGRPSTVSISHWGPAAFAAATEREAAGRFPPLDSAWLALSVHGPIRFSIDTANIERRPAGVWRVRLRQDLAEPMDDPPGGLTDSLVRGVDYDCANRRMQLRTRTTYLRGRR
ncbi:MAG TPA: hypothetical protein VFQ39_01095, partial [Longimicrobium sp.]|nr:hypothetical protein [Longimicrobium sp.]